FALHGPDAASSAYKANVFARERAVTLLAYCDVRGSRDVPKEWLQGESLLRRVDCELVLSRWMADCLCPLPDADITTEPTEMLPEPVVESIARQLKIDLAEEWRLDQVA